MWQLLFSLQSDTMLHKCMQAVQLTTAGCKQPTGWEPLPKSMCTTFVPQKVISSLVAHHHPERNGDWEICFSCICGSMHAKRA
jgi:hypothetical protein